MKSKNPFDEKINLMNKRPDQVEGLAFVRDAAIYVTDTVDLAWASALSVFEERATPELALQIYDRINAERLRLEQLGVDDV